MAFDYDRRGVIVYLVLRDVGVDFFFATCFEADLVDLAAALPLKIWSQP